MRLTRRTDDATSCFIFQLHIAAGMVWMPMRVPDRVDRPAARLRLVEVFATIGRVDRDSCATFHIVDKETVIIIQAGELVNIKHAPI